MFQLWLYAYETKARNPRNTVASTNPVFNFLMTSNDLNDLQKCKCFNCGFMHIIFDPIVNNTQLLLSVMLLYSLGSQLLIYLHKALVQTFSFKKSFYDIRGHQMVKHWICCCYYISWVPSFRLICIKPQLKYFLFVEVIQVIRGH